jgi:hypothetical protein
MAQVGECLPSKHEVLSSNPTTAKNKQTKKHEILSSNPSTTKRKEKELHSVFPSGH